MKTFTAVSILLSILSIIGPVHSGSSDDGSSNRHSMVRSRSFQRSSSISPSYVAGARPFERIFGFQVPSTNNEPSSSYSSGSSSSNVPEQAVNDYNGYLTGDMLPLMMRQAAISTDYFDYPMCHSTINNRLSEFDFDASRERDNEDRYVTSSFSLSDDNTDIFVFGVFDGHYGGEVAQWLSDNLVSEIGEAFAKQEIKSFRTVKSRRFEIPDMIKSAVLKMDRDICLKYQFESGASASFIVRIETLAFIVNLGNARTVVVRDGFKVFESVDHKASNALEAEHIMAAGGVVRDGKLNRIYSMSRAFGDCYFKRKGRKVSKSDQFYTAQQGLMRALPTVSSLELDDGHVHVFLLGSFGLFQGVETDDIVKYLNLMTMQGKEGQQCEQLVSMAKPNTHEDITALIVKFD